MKRWRDFLYCSKGERRALSVLLALMAINMVWLHIGSVADKVYRAQEGVAVVVPPPASPSGEKSVTPAAFIVQPENAPKPMQIEKRASATFPVKQKNRNVYPKTEKYPAGTVVELNTADTTSLKKVPGIGSTFAKRIVGYRRLLGGFYSVTQLREVYGIDEERYQALQKWFAVDTSFIAKLSVNELPSDSLRKHPYLSYEQARAIYSLRRRKGRLSGWDALLLLEEFSQADREKLQWYVAF